MKKDVVIVNDEIGTIALGFSKAGYEIKTIINDKSDLIINRIVKENWGDIVRSYPSSHFEEEELESIYEVNVVAGKIRFDCLSMAGKKRKRENANTSQIIHILRKARPRYFIFQYSKTNSIKSLFEEFRISVEEIGYRTRTEKFDVKLFTGLPVVEKSYFLFGSYDVDDINLDILKNIDVNNISFYSWWEKYQVDNSYYRINERYIRDIERKSYECILCWSNNHYKEERYIRWNPIMIPLVAEGNNVRKITHREIARLKGIPDEYVLDINNKSWLYGKLMYSANVQLVQQLASVLIMDTTDKQYHNREVSMAARFEEILLSYFRQKGVKDVCEINRINTNVDFQFKVDNILNSFDFRIYRNNNGIKAKLINICVNHYEQAHINEENTIIVVGNIVGTELKKYFKEKYNIFIWDVENIMWILDEFPQLKNDFVSLLSFSISSIVPKAPELNLFKIYSKYSIKVDLQEKLRKIQPGRNDASKYEIVCEDIMKFLFSDNLQFFEPQRNSNEGLYRFDYCGKIKHGNTSEFFDTVQKFFNTKYIIFEFKNYDEKITQKEIYTTEKYLYEKALRKVAIIVTRKGSDENAKKATIGSLRESGRLIICLSDEDINNLIDMKNKNEDPSDYLEDLLDGVMMDLAK